MPYIIRSARPVSLFLFSVVLLLIACFSSGEAQNLKDPELRADYVVITPHEYLPIADRLSTFRRMHDGYAVLTVTMDTILAQFPAGARADSSVKKFIQYALDHWREPRPAYFVLAGNTNVIPSHSEQDLIAVYKFNANDSIMVDHWFVEGQPNASGYGEARAVLGRLPAWDSLGLSTMVSKIIAYETHDAQEWSARAIGLADIDPDSPALFENDLKPQQKLLAEAWKDTITVHIRLNSPSHLDSMAFVNLLNQGASIVTYRGHANPLVLSSTRYFTRSSIDSLVNAGRLPIFFFGGCNLKFNTPPPSSLPVYLLESAQGGAAAAIASAGLMYESDAGFFLTTIYDHLIKHPADPVGVAFMTAKNKAGFEVIRRYTFLGDPAIHIKRAGVTAVAGHAAVTASSYVLAQNYPNPFNPSTTISFTLPEPAAVTLVVYDIVGRTVATLVNEERPAGTFSVPFDGHGMTSGMYFYRMTAKHGESVFTDTKRFVLMK